MVSTELDDRDFFSMSMRLAKYLVIFWIMDGLLTSLSDFWGF